MWNFIGLLVLGLGWIPYDIGVSFYISVICCAVYYMFPIRKSSIKDMLCLRLFHLLCSNSTKVLYKWMANCTTLFMVSPRLWYYNRFTSSFYLKVFVMSVKKQLVARNEWLIVSFKLLSSLLGIWSTYWIICKIQGNIILFIWNFVGIKEMFLVKLNWSAFLLYKFRKIVCTVVTTTRKTWINKDDLELVLLTSTDQNQI